MIYVVVFGVLAVLLAGCWLVVVLATRDPGQRAAPRERPRLLIAAGWVAHAVTWVLDWLPGSHHRWPAPIHVCADCHHEPGDPQTRLICECPCHGVTAPGPDGPPLDYEDTGTGWAAIREDIL